MPSRRSRRCDLEAALADARGQPRRQERELRDLREEADVLRQAAERLIHHAPARERLAFIHTLRDRFAVRRICRIIATDHAGYFAWVRAEHKRTARNIEDRELLQLIIEVHTAHPAYGAQRVTQELKNQGTQVGRRRVARLTREHGIAGITRHKRRSLTKPDQRAAAVPDLLQRNFTAPMPGLKLTGDISCFRTSEGWIHFAAESHVETVSRQPTMTLWICSTGQYCTRVLARSGKAPDLPILDDQATRQAIDAETANRAPGPLADVVW